MRAPKRCGGKLGVLDLYCGLGGLSLGLELTGAFETIGGIDNFAPAVETFYYNHSNIKSRLLSQTLDLSQLRPEQVLDDLGRRPDVIVGGPPCQGFSHAGRRLEDLKEDPRNRQIFHYFRFIRAMRPKAFLMENVSGILKTGQQSKHELIDAIVREYEKLGYVVAWRVLNTSGFRVPQNRKRFIMVGIENGKAPFSFPMPPCNENWDLFGEPLYTVFDALGDMPTPTKEDPQCYEYESQTPLQRFLRVGSEWLYNHSQTVHSPEMVRRLKAQKVGTRLYPSWNHSWYRLDPERPSPAVKENHRAPFVHFEEPRATSPRECARLQCIPDRYRLIGTKTAQLIMVGNAVPAIFSAHLGTAIARQALGKEPPSPWSAEENPLTAGAELRAEPV